MSPDKTKVCFQDVEGQFKVVMLDRIERGDIAKRSQPGVYGFWSMSSDKVLFLKASRCICVRLLRTRMSTTDTWH